MCAKSMQTRYKEIRTFHSHSETVIFLILSSLALPPSNARCKVNIQNSSFFSFRKYSRKEREEKELKFKSWMGRQAKVLLPATSLRVLGAHVGQDFNASRATIRLTFVYVVVLGDEIHEQFREKELHTPTFSYGLVLHDCRSLRCCPA